MHRKLRNARRRLLSKNTDFGRAYKYPNNRIQDAKDAGLLQWPG